MKLSHCLAATAAALFVTGVAHAEDKGSLTVSLPALKYSTVSTKRGSDADKEAGLKSVDLSDAYVQATFGKVNFYVNPFQTTKKFSVSYSISDAIEAGLNLGLNSWKIDKAKVEDNSTLVGLWGFYYLAMGSMTGEFGLGFDSTTMKSTPAPVAPAPTSDKKESSKTDITITVNDVIPLAKNVSFVPGFSYVMSTTNKKKPTPTQKDTDNALNLTVASFRVTLD